MEGKFSSRIGGRFLPAVEDVLYLIHCHELTTINNMKQLAANIYTLAHSVALISTLFGITPELSLPLDCHCLWLLANMEGPRRLGHVQ